jgi:hypothetical protein
MNELVEVDLEVSRQTQVCVILPSRGEELAILREAILGIMSLHLWPGKLDVRRNVRLVVVDDHRRPEVKMLVSLCYRLATMFYNNRKVRLPRTARPLANAAPELHALSKVEAMWQSRVRPKYIS